MIQKNRNVYKTPLAEQTEGEMLNSILWRLAVASCLAVGDSKMIHASPDEILRRVEEQLHRHNNLGQ